MTWWKWAVASYQRCALFLDKGNTIKFYTSRIESQVDQHFAKKKQASLGTF